MAYVLRGTWSAVSDGYATVYVSGTARVRDQVSLGSGALLKITSGAFVDGLTAVKGSVSVAAGGVLANSQLDDSTLTVASGGIIQTNNLNSTETTLGSGAQSYNDTWFNSGYDANWVTVAAGASIMQSQILKGGYLRVSSGGSAAGVVVSAGGSAILASGTTDGFTAMSGGYVQLGTAFYSGSTVNGTELVNASVLSGTWSAVNLDGGTVYQSGTVIVSGPAVLGTSAVLYIKNGAVASQLSGYLVSVVIEAGGNLDSSVIINGSVRIAAGGASTNNALNSTATTVASGGSSFNDVWYNSGYDINVATFQSGASISGAQVLNGGSLSVQTGATGNDIYVSGTGTATFSAGSVENYTAAPGGKVVSGTMTYSGILVGDNSYDNTRVLSGVWSAIDSDGTTVFRSGSVSVQWPVTFASGATLYISSGAQVAAIKAVATTVQVLNGGLFINRPSRTAPSPLPAVARPPAIISIPRRPPMAAAPHPWQIAGTIAATMSTRRFFSPVPRSGGPWSIRVAPSPSVPVRRVAISPSTRAVRRLLRAVRSTSIVRRRGGHWSPAPNISRV